MNITQFTGIVNGHTISHPIISIIQLYLELAAELFLEDDFSLRLRKLLARLSSLLKLLTLLREGLSALCGVSRGELGGSGERHVRGEGDLIINQG